MTITPFGFPSWLRNNNITDVDGHPDKRNRDGSFPVDPKTDLSAEGQSRLHQIVYALEKTAPFAVMKIDPDAPGYVASYLGQHGIGITNAPTVTRVATGYWRIVWAASYTDPYNVLGATRITTAQSSPYRLGGNRLYSDWEIINDRTVEVRVWEEAWLNIDGIFSLTVWTEGDFA